MSSVNKVILIGNLGKDPETRYTSSGESVANVSLATSESWKDKAGEKKERVEWHKLSFFGKLAEVVGQYLKKGGKIYIEGKLQTRKWQDKDGADRYTTEIVCDRMQMLGTKPKEGEGEEEPAPATSTTGNQYRDAREGRAPAKSTVDDLDDDIPF